MVLHILRLTLSTITSNSALGRSFKLHKGIPQGAVLFPLLFLFYIDGIRDVASERVKVSLYADDIAVWAQSRDNRSKVGIAGAFGIFLAMINSILNYCGAAWQPWLAKKNVLILERIQNRALRVLTGHTSDTPLECLRLEVELPSFETSIRRN